MSLNRRAFLKNVAATTGALVFPQILIRAAQQDKSDSPGSAEDDAIRERIEAHRPSRLKALPSDFNARVGATHTGGKYHFTGKPFLLEGAEKLLELGTRLGKFWFIPDRINVSYPFNSVWPECQTLTDLAGTDYFQQLFQLPFRTLILEAHCRRETAWRTATDLAPLLANVTEQFHDLTAFLYKQFRDRAVTIILQHWEGDWLLRGRGGETWENPPANWRAQCERMQRWLAARQAGVSRARANHGAGAKCRVGHAAEVNRVADLWKNIPTMTQYVLPEVELDLVSYSAYDSMNDAVRLWKCIGEIRKHARSTGAFGTETVFVGEIGFPENERKNVTERWDQAMGAMLAAKMPYIAMWELYCNELNPKIDPPPRVPVKNSEEMRGFWLVRPDGELSEAGKYFTALWRRSSGRQNDSERKPKQPPSK